MTVFRAGPGQAALVARLLDSFNAEFGSASPPVQVLTRRFAKLLHRDDVLVYVAGSAESPLGFALVTLRPTPYDDGPLATLDELYVVPAQRGRGHGGTLLATVLAELRRRGCGEMHINVDEDDVDTRRFYEARGFSNYEQGTTERMLLYARELRGGA